MLKSSCLSINLELEFNENTMDVACGVLKKFNSFIANCYSHLNTSDDNHITDTALIEVLQFNKV